MFRCAEPGRTDAGPTQSSSSKKACAKTRSPAACSDNAPSATHSRQIRHSHPHPTASPPASTPASSWSGSISASCGKFEQNASVVSLNWLVFRRKGFSPPTRRERRAYPLRSVRSEQQGGRRKGLRPEGLRRKWPGALLLVSHSPRRGCSFLAPRPKPFWAQRTTSQLRDTTLALSFAFRLRGPLYGAQS